MARVLHESHTHLDACAHGGRDRVGVQHARAEMAQLFRVSEPQTLDRSRVGHDGRVRGEHTWHALPKLNRAGMDRLGQERRREIGAVPPQGGQIS